jgi:hypothetical protein
MGLWPFACSGLRVRNPPMGMDVCLLCMHCVVRYKSLRLADHSSRAQSSPTECRVSECDRETSIMMRLWYTRCCYAIKKQSLLVCSISFESKHLRFAESNKTTVLCNGDAMCYFGIRIYVVNSIYICFGLF